MRKELKLCHWKAIKYNYNYISVGLHYKRPQVSRYLRNDAALGEKLPIFAAALRFVSPSAVNPVKIRTNLTCSETTVHISHIFVADG